ncbi:MAG: helix-turn-helix domain-containing protein [Mesorhizobium sp.]|uniref:transcriptional regulator n=1 Tax=Mesorhizobium sp. TaxID=1871066 RepID=UPI000FE69F6F|nr:MAG: helix-turn-helix domain-containing protein [Mesorhizobium sp.]
MADLHSHIERAVALLGSQAKLAEAAGYSQQYISWLLSGTQRRVSAEAALAFEKATGGEVSRHDLRPDIFGPARESAA